LALVCYIFAGSDHDRTYVAANPQQRVAAKRSQSAEDCVDG
jgi:hypothetical protein